MLASLGAKPLGTLDPATISPAAHALFLDFDGTIAPIVAHPDAAWPTERWLDLVPRLRRAFGGALALVTGRELSDIDRRFPCAEPLYVGAMYGSMRRSRTGIVEAAADLVDRFAAIAEDLRPFAAAHTGLLVEEKSAGVSLHFRARPELEGLCLAALRAATAADELIEIVPGKRVFEARPKAVDKGRCIAAFLLDPPFHGRVPIFAGDDVPDEEGFRLVNGLGGLSIKVGHGETAALYRAASSSELAAWLDAVIARH